MTHVSYTILDGLDERQINNHIEFLKNLPQSVSALEIDVCLNSSLQAIKNIISAIPPHITSLTLTFGSYRRKEDIRTSFLPFLKILNLLQYRIF